MASTGTPQCDVASGSTLQAFALTLGIDPGRLLGITPPEQDTSGAEQLRRAVWALDLPGSPSRSTCCRCRSCTTRHPVPGTTTSPGATPNSWPGCPRSWWTSTGQFDRAVQLAAQVPGATGTVPTFWESGHRLHLAGVDQP